MTALSWLALVVLVGAAGLGTGLILQALIPGLPDDLRGFASASMTIAAAALVIERVTA